MCVVVYDVYHTDVICCYVCTCDRDATYVLFFTAEVKRMRFGAELYKKEKKYLLKIVIRYYQRLANTI